MKEKTMRVVLMVAFPLYQLSIIAVNYQYMFSKESGWNYLSIVGSFCNIAGAFTLCKIMKKNEKKKMIEQEINKIRYKEKLSSIYRSSLVSQQQERKLINDEMKKALNELKNQQARGESFINEKFEGLCHRMEDWEFPGCRNPLIQAVLLEKREECKINNVQMIINIRLNEVPGVMKVHLCSLLTNLLDNAILAAQQETNNKRKVYINAGIKADYLVVEVGNSTSYEYACKQPELNHGYGKKILCDIAQKYDGYYEASLSGEFYKAVVALKVGVA